MASYGTLPVDGATLCYKVRGEGPVLLVLQGGSGTADTSDGIASELERDWTVVSYDRRGLLRSPLDDPGQPLTIERHAEDAARLAAHVSDAPVTLFASSVGGLIGLEYMSRAPERVRLLVAHEPPVIRLLSESARSKLSALREEVRQLALREGPRPAFRLLLDGMGANRDDREEDAEPPASSRYQSRETGFLLTREARTTDDYVPNFDALAPCVARVVPAVGASSRDCYPAECTRALALKLGRPAVEFPGGHTGYVLRPRAFARTLRDVLLGSTRLPQRPAAVETATN